MLKVATLASGSSGNCTVVSDGSIHILIDAGISARRTVTGLRELGLEPDEIAAIFITHEHSDHINGLRVLSRQIGADLYTTTPTAEQICYKFEGLESRFRVFDPGDRLAIGGLEVGSFAISHDCACPVGFTVTDGKRRMALCTDTGVVTQQAAAAVQGVNTLIGEFNYDEQMLKQGPYPAYLKQRILSDRGHLSNEVGGQFAAWAVQQGTQRVIMAHLSKENNMPGVARRAAQEAFEAIGAKVDRDVELIAASRSERSDWMEV